MSPGCSCCFFRWACPFAFRIWLLVSCIGIVVSKWGSNRPYALGFSCARVSFVLFLGIEVSACLVKVDDGFELRLGKSLEIFKKK
jgi:hypothetical protein